MRTIRDVVRILIVLGLLALNTQARSSAILYTTPDFDPNNPWHVSSWYVDGLGEPKAQAIGQVFKLVTTTDPFLTDFSFWVKELDGANVTLDALLLEWNPVMRKPTGAPLFTFSAFTTANNSNQGGYEKVTFDVGNILLNIAKPYIAILSTEGYEDGVRSTLGIGFSGSDKYADGELYWYQSGIWGTVFYSDYAFEARFASEPVPEPSTAILLLLGLLLIAVAEKSRRAVATAIRLVC